MIAQLACLLLVLGGADTAPAPLLPQGVSLVRAVVVDTEEIATGAVNKLRVQHVYAGSPDILGSTFSARSAARPIPRVSGYVIVPRLAQGEVGIWLVKEANRNLYTKNFYNYMRWPARVDPPSPNAPRYETVRAFAEAVERLAGLRKRADLIAALKGLSSDENPYLSSWAVSRLAVAATNDEDVGDFLDRLVGVVGVPIQGQVELDNALIDVRGAAWRESKQRYELFHDWLTGGPAPSDADRIVAHLNLASQQPALYGFPQDQLLELTKLLVENGDFPLAQRQRSRSILMWAARRYDTDQKVFEMAVDLVGSDLPEELRTRMAWVLAVDVDLNAGRREILRGLRMRVRNPSVVKTLDDALTRPNDTKKPL